MSEQDGGMTGGAAYGRGRCDAYQDRCENIPFSSVGGLGARSDMKAPHYVAEADAAEYLRGYRDMVESMYGPDWQTCTFGWRPVLTIKDED